MSGNKLHQLVVYVPENAAEAVKRALFDAGAGRVGNYDRCCWQTLGTGQLRPLEGSRPAIGKQDQVEHIPEIRLEMVVPEKYLRAALDALQDAHPYETPAYSHWSINTEQEKPHGNDR
jgi:hypothetical protein